MDYRLLYNRLHNPHSQYFNTYKPCSSNRKITMENGTHPCKNRRCIISQTVTPKNDLYVQKLSNSLFSIQKLIHDRHYNVIFSSSELDDWTCQEIEMAYTICNYLREQLNMHLCHFFVPLIKMLFDYISFA